MPRPYEVVYIFDSSLEDSVIADKLTKFHAMLGGTARRRQTCTSISGVGASSPTRSVPARLATTPLRGSAPKPTLFPNSNAPFASMTESSDTSSRCTSTRSARPQCPRKIWSRPDDVTTMTTMRNS